MILTFYGYINESRGISNFIKKISTIKLLMKLLRNKKFIFRENKR